MNNKQLLLKFYGELLDSAGLKHDKDGYISSMEGNKPVMVKMTGFKDLKRLVLPTDGQMSNLVGDSKCVAFHPGSENIMRGESEVMAEYRSALGIKLNFSFSLLIAELLALAAEPARHAKLKPDQHEFLSHVKKADEQTLNTFAALLKQMPLDQTVKQFVHIYLKKAARLKGVNYKRAAIVSFPLYKELKEMPDGDRVWGVKLRVKDRESLISVIEYVLPGLVQDESYSRGSSSDVAPSLDALMRSYVALGSNINDAVDLFGNVLASAKELALPSEWMDLMNDQDRLARAVRSIPPLSGNEGLVNKTEAGLVHQDHQATTVAAPVAAPAATTPFVPPSAVAPAYTGFPPVATPQGYYPSMTPQQQQPLPAPVVTANGVNFNSIIASNPTVRAATGAMMVQQAHLQHASYASAAPRWAQGGGYAQGPNTPTMYGNNGGGAYGGGRGY